MARSISQQLALRQRQAAAVTLRRDGHTYQSIAIQLGYSHASGARKAVCRALREIGQEIARDLARLQYERLNELLATTWPAATDVQHPKCLRAVDATLRIMDKLDRVAPPYHRPRGQIPQSTGHILTGTYDRGD